MNEESGRALRRPAPLPTTSAEWLKDRKVKIEPTLNDHVEGIHLILLDHPTLGARYNKLLDAVYDEDATEGSLSYDNFQAAAQIRAFAKGRNDGDDDAKPDDTVTTRNPYVAGKLLSTLVKALNVVLNRYGKSRKQRSRTVAGEVVPSDSDNNGA